MRQRRHLLVIPVALSMGLASCTGSPDWEAAQSEADAFTTAASTSAGYLGGGTLRATQDGEVPLDREGIMLDYPSEVRVDGFRAVCFGGGEATFGLLVRAESSWSGIDPLVLTCNGEPRAVSLDAPFEHINAIRLNGRLEEGTGAVIAAAATGATE